jgi:hypothetical protein
MLSFFRPKHNFRRTFAIFAPLWYHNSREVLTMKKTTIFFTADEIRLVIASLNEHRNKLITAGRYTDTADDVLLKVLTAPTKKIKIA